MSSSGLRDDYLSNRDKVRAGYKPRYLALPLPLLIQNLSLQIINFVINKSRTKEWRKIVIQNKPLELVNIDYPHSFTTAKTFSSLGYQAWFEVVVLQ